MKKILVKFLEKGGLLIKFLFSVFIKIYKKIPRKIIKFTRTFLVIFLLAYIIIPKPDLLNKYFFSTAVYDKDGKLLYMKVSVDEKYRLFTPLSEISPYTIKSTLLYEDKYFYYHLGFNPVALIKSSIEAVEGKRIRGASTITMQTARMLFKIDSSRIGGKINQILRALQLEFFYSKDKILETYFNLAPYGYNVEGIEAASNIYFHKRAKNLIINEAIALSVIPQNPTARMPLTSGNASPELIKSQIRLADIYSDNENFTREKRTELKTPLNFYSIKKLPFTAPHFTQMMINKYQFKGSIFTNLNSNLQQTVQGIVQEYIKKSNNLKINNTAVLIVNWQTMNVETMVGSADYFNNSIDGQVNGTAAYRSPGSSLKPFIYALALDQGIIHPLTLLKDTPQYFSIYNPNNIDNKFMGPISVTQALTLSRNIPAVNLLNQLKGFDFYDFLKAMDVKNLKSKGYYGLALALGGFEVSMLDEAKMYALLRNYGEEKELNFLKVDSEHTAPKGKILISPEASFLALNMLKFTHPPKEFKTLLNQKSIQNTVYWKTGTSYSYKDGWASAIVGPYVIIVWTGNFNGDPNPNFIGLKSSGTLLFNIIQKLEKLNFLYKTPDFYKKDLNVKLVDICKLTGDLPNKYCKETIKSWYIPGKSPLKTSNILRAIPINKSTGLRACYYQEGITEMKVYEFWPSDLVSLFKKAGIYKTPPPRFEKNCDMNMKSSYGEAPIIQSPRKNIKYSLEINKQNTSELPFKAILDTDATNAYWFIDNKFLGKSKNGEPYFWKEEVGSHNLVVVDDLGRSSNFNFTVELNE